MALNEADSDSLIGKAATIVGDWADARGRRVLAVFVPETGTGEEFLVEVLVSATGPMAGQTDWSLEVSFLGDDANNAGTA